MQSSPDPLGMTGSTCLKSPPKTTTFPPNKVSFSVISLRRVSSASIDYLFAIDASSQIMSAVCFERVAKLVCFPTLQQSLASLVMGILNRE